METNTVTETKKKPARLTVRVEFQTTDYQFAHGRMPRGYGGWAFSMKRHPTELGANGPVFWAPQGTYAEAKKAAREHFEAKAEKALAGRTGVEFVDVWVLS